MITTEVAFARSTWRKSKEFNDGVRDLELRRGALLGELQYVDAQAQLWLEEHPADAERIAAKYHRTQATPEMLLGTAVMNGESPALGFSPDTYLIAPSLRVYELFMWCDESESWGQN